MVKMRREYFKIRKVLRKWDRASGKFHIDLRYKTKTEITPRTIGVAEAFGLGVDEHKEHVVYDNVTIKISPTDIVYITGESGSGKSVLLRALENDLGDEAINIENIEIDPDKPIIDTVGQNLDEGLELLSRVGLNDAYLFIRRYSQLSDGQKYRYRLAKLIESGERTRFWVMDEFCACLDRDTAKIVAFNMQKQARRAGRAIFVATTHEDLFEDLAPSVHIHKGWGKRIQVKYYPNEINRVCSVTRDLRIEEGSREDYHGLAEFHYRNPKTLPIPLKIYSLRRGDGMVVGVIMYAYPPVNCAGRQQAFGRRIYIKEANKILANISRVVLHPKYRSIGLGIQLVKETLPLVGRPYVETTAVMAKYCPFFEKAGMTKIMESCGDPSVLEAVEKLDDLGFRPYALASEEANLHHLRKLNPRDMDEVREILLGISSGYHKRLKCSSKAYVKKAEFEAFIEKASVETLATVLCRLAVLSQTKVYLLWRNPAFQTEYSQGNAIRPYM